MCFDSVQTHKNGLNENQAKQFTYRQISKKTVFEQTAIFHIYL